MSGSEFIRRVEAVGRNRGITVQFVPRRGKGGHGTLFYGEKFTIVAPRAKELKKGTTHGMLKQLGLLLEDLNG